MVAINTGGHSIRVLNERSVSAGINLCSLCLEILNSVPYSVGDTLIAAIQFAEASHSLFAAVTETE